MLSPVSPDHPNLLLKSRPITNILPTSYSKGTYINYAHKNLWTPSPHPLTPCVQTYAGMKHWGMVDKSGNAE